MNIEQFKSAFLLSPQTQKQRVFPRLRKANKTAAVLVPFILREDGLRLLLTQRSNNLRHHPGQISFPGGRFEEYDENLKTTALRETFEETGIETKHISIFGQLGQYQTISNYIVTPYLAEVSKQYQLKVDQNEVADVFEVPWKFFFERENHHQLSVNRMGSSMDIHFMPYNERFIWGTTALMIHDLVSHFEYS